MSRLSRGLLTSLALASSASAQSIVRLSVGTSGAEANGHSGDCRISADGRIVAFGSYASNLVPLDTNGAMDVFVHDRASGAIRRVSVTSTGSEEFGTSALPFVSANGRYVVFTSQAQLDGMFGVTDWKPYVHDLELGTTTLVTLFKAWAKGISNDGRFVLLTTDWSLVPGDTNNAEDVYVRDRVAGTSELISVGLSGAAEGGGQPAMSSDARFVVFTSAGTSLVAGDTNGHGDVFLRDRATGATTRVNVDASGAQIDFGTDPSISADGRFIAFVTTPDLTGVGPTFNGKAYVRDLATGGIELVSVTNQGAPPDWDVRLPQLSPDGRFVAYMTFATNLGGAHPGGYNDVFLYDRQLGQTRLVSHDQSGNEPDGQSPAYGYIGSIPNVSSSGLTVFNSEATNLVGQADTNASHDVFIAFDAAVPITYCTAGTSAAGCVGSLSAAGTPRLGVASGFVVTASGIDGLRSGIFFYGIGGAVATPWGASSAFVCVANPKQRAPSQSSGGTFGACDGSLSVDWNTLQFNSPGAFGGALHVGSLVHLQSWWRDPPSPKTSMLSNALLFDVLP